MTNNQQNLSKLQTVDRGLWRLHNLAQIGHEAAMNDLVCNGVLSHLLEEMMERCDQLHDLTQKLEAEERDREKQRQQMQEALKNALLEAGEKMVDGGVL